MEQADKALALIEPDGDEMVKASRMFIRAIQDKAITLEVDPDQVEWGQ